MIFDADRLIKVVGIGLLAWISGALVMSARADSQVETYQVNGRATDFLNLEDQRLLISRSCQKAGGKDGALDCQAYAATQRKSDAPEITFHGGENPGALLCHELKGEVVWGVDAHRNQTTFCRFADASMVSNGSLTYWLLVRKK